MDDTQNNKKIFIMLKNMLLKSVFAINFTLKQMLYFEQTKIKYSECHKDSYNILS